MYVCVYTYTDTHIFPKSIICLNLKLSLNLKHFKQKETPKK